MTILINRQRVEALVGFSRSTRYAWMKVGAFPRPIRIGKRSVRWREQEIIDWIDRHSHLLSRLIRAFSDYLFAKDIYREVERHYQAAP